MSSTHWETVFRTTASEELGWYEPLPSTLDLVLRFSEPTDSVIDVGAGDGRMVDALLQAGYGQITALDISAAALDRTRRRLGEDAREVTWIEADVTDWTPEQCWDLWHDRALFHFLVSVERRQAYKAAALRALASGGTLIVSTFALDGPEQCAGQPVARYDGEGLAAVFEPEFRLVEHRRHRGRPDEVGDDRPYVAVVLERI